MKSTRTSSEDAKVRMLVDVRTKLIQRPAYRDGFYDIHITTANGDLHTFLGDLNSRRLPDYHRLDIGLTKTWRIDEHQKVELDISVTNAYDRQNIFYYDRTRNERKDQLPLLPSAGISYTF